MTGTSAIFSGAIPDERSPAVPSHEPFDRARAKLALHAEAWRDRPLIRDIYRGYHEAIAQARSTVKGTDLEVGSGHGSFAEFAPRTISCDIVPSAALDCAADATCLPFRDGSLSNIVMVDVLHHVADPTAFFNEARRTLVPGGRIILTEPYVSPISWIAWRYICEEPIDTKARPLTGSAPGLAVRGDDPWDANVAVPTVLFWQERKAFRRLFPDLSVIRRRRFDMLLYPLSGGFEHRRLVPLPLVPLLRACERLLTPLAPLLAFRCFIVIEKG